ncbi:protein MpCupin83 [Marchantia polymorpha subsp. ruderalis]|nr:hypothetical protein MARPO_0032s0076 [Marchantia polymorpha]BBN11673.1 hypothetical protein Mp_5g13860 [Marchantia polymorpha subsp. ruderalis]|eukprot:PTQ41887.1 hypothetical protein MARPO_0032s0076 [Marchantia polymorpha]
MAFSRALAFMGLVHLMIQSSIAYDPTITTDFGLMGAASGADFTSTAFEADKLPADPAAGGLVLVPQFVGQFPGLTGLGISSLYFKLGAGGLVPPHIHARATELFIVLKGTFYVGFVDGANKLYTATLYPGDQFVFPQALVHYQLAGDSAAEGYSSFNSQNPGVTLIASNVFASTPGIPVGVLSAAFGTDAQTVMKIRTALGG